MYQLSNIIRIRDKLDLESAKTITQALVLSKLDYCNYLLPGSQNANWITSKPSKTWHVELSANLGSLTIEYWLKIREHINYKVATLVYRCCNGTAPSYLNDLLSVFQTIRTLRSPTSCNITPIFSKTKLAMEGSLEINHIKFRKKLKIYIFKKSYPE